MTTSTTPANPRAAARPAALRRHNRRMLVGLTVFVVLMVGFGYAMVPMYRSICEALGVNVIARDDGDGQVDAGAANSQVDLSRSVTIEFDANVRGPWEFHPEQSSVVVHPGALTTVMYEFKNTQSRTMTAQAIPSYAPGGAQPHFNKVQCFCFTQHTLAPGESKRWPVTFFVDDKLPKDIKTITLSYSFFEVGGTMPAAPSGDAPPAPHA
ncbi:MAG TPA: cytochrome c oxidase assembly protein [Burkholderiaceae bacterium]